MYTSYSVGSMQQQGKNIKNTWVSCQQLNNCRSIETFKAALHNYKQQRALLSVTLQFNVLHLSQLLNAFECRLFEFQGFVLKRSYYRIKLLLFGILHEHFTAEIHKISHRAQRKHFRNVLQNWVGSFGQHDLSVDSLHG